MQVQPRNDRQVVMPQIQGQPGLSQQQLVPVQQQLPVAQTDAFITGGHVAPIVKTAAEMERDFMQQVVEMAKRGMTCESTFTLEFIEEK